MYVKVLLVVPVLGVVRTAVDSDGQASALGLVRTGLDEEMGGPYWETFLLRAGKLATPPRGVGWAVVPKSEHLVGISRNGRGNVPAGMAKSATTSQKFIFNFECKDAIQHDESYGDLAPAAADLLSNLTRRSREGSFMWKTHNDWKPHLGTGGEEMVNHIGGANVDVLYEKEGDYMRAVEGIGRGHQLSAPILNCKQLELSIDQFLYMDQAQLRQQTDAAVQALDSAGYSQEEMEAAVRAHERMETERRPETDLDAMIAQEEDPLTRVKFEIRQLQLAKMKAIQVMVRDGVIKQADDHLLVSKLIDARAARAHEELGGRVKFGKGTITNLVAPRTKSTLAFEFEQECTVDYGAATSYCTPGKRGLLLLTGKCSDMGLGDDEDMYVWTRLVLYLEK